ncbi:hypothetical protein [Nocardioides sp. HB32]
MKLALALAAVLLVAACGSDSGTTATDPAGAASPTAVPAAPGQVRTRAIATVMDTGTPELCLGAVAESWPPQCSGPPVDGWDWTRHEGTYQKSDSTRWGQYVVTGTWDGTTLTYEDAVPGAAYDPMAEPSPTYPLPSVEHTRAELQDIADEVGRDLPGAQGASVDGRRVLVDVVYDDGSLQDQVDEQYGEGVVVVVPALVDSE